MDDGQYLRKRQAAGPHLGQDEVGGAVDDAGHPFDLVGRQAFADGLDDGDAAGHGRFEGDHDTLFARAGEDLVAVLGQQGLVGGDDVLAVGNGFQDEFAGQGVAAYQLDHDVDLGVADDLERVGDDFGGFADAGLGLGDIAGRNFGRDDVAAGAAGDFFGVAGEDLESAAAYDAQAQEAYSDGFHCVSGQYRVLRKLPRPGFGALRPAASAPPVGAGCGSVLRRGAGIAGHGLGLAILQCNGLWEAEGKTRGGKGIYNGRTTAGLELWRSRIRPDRWQAYSLPILPPFRSRPFEVAFRSCLGAEYRDRLR